MIRRFKLTDRAATHFDAFADPFVLPVGEFHFSEGVNIVLGPSGGGKSALLHFIARLLHCTTGFQCVDVKSCELIQRGLLKQTIKGFELEHNGAPACFYDPLNYKVTSNHGSVPRRNISGLFGGRLAPLDLANEKRGILKSYLVGSANADEHEAVYLIDSPETGMSIEQIANFCGMIGGFGKFLAESGMTPSTQVIVATNHPYIAGIKNANRVETHADYILKFDSISRNIAAQISK